MTAKGIITSINMTENTCTVRIPVLETAGNADKNEATAIFAIPPGIFNGYKVDDVVIVGFESENTGYPVILGKLYKDTTSESKNSGGAIYCTDLTVSNSAYLPADIHIGYTTDKDKKVQNSEVLLTSLNTMNDIINAVRTNSEAINKLKSGGVSTIGSNQYSIVEQQVGSWIDNSIIYRKTFVYDFVENNIGQTQLSEWTTAIDLSSLNFNMIHELSDQTFMTTIDSASGDTASTTEYFNDYIDMTNKRIVINGQTDKNLPNKFYITVEYTKK